MTNVTHPQSFYDFSLQFHADMNLTHPDLPSFRRLYEGFRTRHGDNAVKELAAYLKRLRADSQVDLEAVWYDSKADMLFPEQGLRQLFEDFEVWAASLR